MFSVTDFYRIVVMILKNKTFIDCLQWMPIIILGFPVFLFCKDLFWNSTDYRKKKCEWINEFSDMYLLVIMFGALLAIHLFHPNVNLKEFFQMNDYIFGLVFSSILYFIYVIWLVAANKFNKFKRDAYITKISMAVALGQYFFIRIFKVHFNNSYFTWLFLMFIINLICDYCGKCIRFGTQDGVCCYGYDDIPAESISDLIDSRKRQAEFLCEEFRTVNTKEPYAIMIEGEWGSGKTSLINAIKNDKKTQNEFEFVTISVGYGLNSDVYIKDIENQVCNIFEKDKFFSFREKNIQRYFEKMSKVSSVAVDSKIGEIYDILFSNKTSLENAKQEFNNVLCEYKKQTGKRIIIVIDDLERCYRENIKNLFSLLVETCNLNNCITLLVSDYEKIIETGEVDADYLDKYINRRYYISDVSFGEVFKQVVLPSIEKNIPSNMNIAEYRKVFCDYYDCIVELHSDLLSRNDDLNKTYGFISLTEKEYDVLNDFLKIKAHLLWRKLCNPRAAKKILLLGIERAHQSLVKEFGKDIEFKARGMESYDKSTTVSHKSAVVFGILRYVFTETYDYIIKEGLYYFDLNKKNEIHDRDELVDNGPVLDYLLYYVLVRFLNNNEKKHLDWLFLNLKEPVIQTEDYKTDYVLNEIEERIKENEIQDHKEIFEKYIFSIDYDVNNIIGLIRVCEKYYKIEEDMDGNIISQVLSMVESSTKYEMKGNKVFQGYLSGLVRYLECQCYLKSQKLIYYCYVKYFHGYIKKDEKIHDYSKSPKNRYMSFIENLYRDLYDRNFKVLPDCKTLLDKSIDIVEKAPVFDSEEYTREKQHIKCVVEKYFRILEQVYVFKDRNLSNKENWYDRRNEAGADLPENTLFLIENVQDISIGLMNDRLGRLICLLPGSRLNVKETMCDLTMELICKYLSMLATINRELIQFDSENYKGFLEKAKTLYDYFKNMNKDKTDEFISKYYYVLLKIQEFSSWLQ